MMEVVIVNQEPLKVDKELGQKIVTAIEQGAEYVTIGNEFVRSNVIMAVRDCTTNETLPKTAWGMLPPGKLEHFFDDNREPAGDGYKKFKETKSKLLGRKSA